ncbi:hypothetical protein PH213_16990 [Streptomyces sp. SRF1]|uniref:hypothetical protein n=1 Tax=Streptomyces sp. SRF1 TaxID=1549642 RepID=UPI0025B07ADD|nr:hypothetical protein [Streptomyces sp. SRF1]MDN3056212.1 hypothetical protein [Streptomyces sp. SRF1]
MSREHLALVVSHLVFAIGLALVVVGAGGDYPRLADLGAGVALGTVPFVILARVRRSNHITHEAAEALRREGYRLGLEHAARGLLTPPPVTDDGQGVTSPSRATVHPLPAVPHPRRSAASGEKARHCR